MGVQMTEAGRSEQTLEVRRRRALFRSWHRGMREVDLILGRFAQERIFELSEPDLSDLERLLEVMDADLLKWILGQEPVPDRYDSPVFRMILAFRQSNSA